MADLTRTVAILFQGDSVGAARAAADVEQRLGTIGAEAGGATGKVAALEGQLEQIGGAAPKIDQAVVALRALAASLIVKDFIDANTAFETFQRSLELTTGSTSEAAKELQFVRDVSQQLGLEVRGAASAYASLAAATNGTTLEGERTRDIFEAVSRAMAALGRSSDETGGAFLAITQIVSKGRVSLEELNGQLGERLPGALQIAARGLGVTTEELIKLVESGTLTAERFLPAFAAELDATFAAARFDGYTSNFNRLKNALTDTFIVIGESGAFDLLVRGIEVATASITGAAATVGLFGDIVEALFRKLTLGSNFDFGEAVAQAMNLAADRTRAARDQLLGVDEAAKDAGASGEAAGTRIAEGLGQGEKSAAQLKAAAKQVDEALKALGINPQTLVDPAEKINQAFRDLTSSAASGETVITGLIGALRNLPSGESASQIASALDAAFKSGKISAAEYEQGIAILKVRLDGLSPSFQAATEGAKAQAKAVDDTAKSAAAAEKAAKDYALELEKIASNERIKNIEAKVALNVAEIEADAKKVAATFESLSTTIGSTGDLIGDLFGLLQNYDNLNFSAIRLIEKQIDAENARRQQALDLQKQLTQAQIAELRARTQQIEKGDAIIKVDGAGLQPHLEAFMWEILRTIQIRVNAQGLEMLLGL